MLPFVGVAHIGYLPGDRILGLSKFARMVDLHARRPQTQERLTKRIADHLQGELQPRGVGVVIEAEHTCMSLRGAQSHRRPHHHLRPVRPAPRRPPQPRRVPRPHQEYAMNIVVDRRRARRRQRGRRASHPGIHRRHHPDRQPNPTRRTSVHRSPRVSCSARADPDSVFVHDTAWYADQQVDLLTGTTVTDIDLDTGHVTVAGPTAVLRPPAPRHRRPTAAPTARRQLRSRRRLPPHPRRRPRPQRPARPSTS